MMVTILLGEQGAMIALSSHSDPPLIYFYLKRPVSSCSSNPLIYSDLRRPGSSHSSPPLIYSAWTMRWDGYTQAHAERQRERHYYTTYGTAGCMTSMEPVGRQYSVSLAYGHFTGRRSPTMSGLSVA